MSGHTPGPWSGSSKPHDSVPYLHFYGPDGLGLWHDDRPEAEKMANHALTIAAPLLLAACKSARGELTRLQALLDHDEDHDSIETVVGTIDAAIAEAEQP